ncbi:MAG: hypothetical protein Q9220_003758 [cf. Caloplaca sp. 1 TL-2023]
MFEESPLAVIDDHKPELKYHAHKTSGTIAPAPIQLNDEFSGLVFQFDRTAGETSEFTVEQIALAAITAMKEEAVLDYTQAVTLYLFVDLLHAENPVRMEIYALPGAPVSYIKRSTIMWTLQQLALELIRTRYLKRVVFRVQRGHEYVYGGLLDNRNQLSTPSRNAENTTANSIAQAQPNSLAIIPTTENIIRLKNTSSLQDDPRYELRFDFVGYPLSQLSIFESLLTLMLSLGAVASDSLQPLIQMRLRNLGAWIFMVKNPGPVQDHPFRQSQAVAILEAIARYYVQYNSYREMTFQLFVNGQLSARGCVTRPVASRVWCTGMFSDMEQLTASG